MSWKTVKVEDHEQRHFVAYNEKLQRYCDRHMSLLKQAVERFQALAASVKAFSAQYEGKANDAKWLDGIEMYNRMGTSGSKKK